MTEVLLLHHAHGPVTTAFRKAALGEADPFGPYREIAWRGPDAMAAGRVDFAGEIAAARFPHIETIVVVEGELTLAAAGQAPLVMAPGAGAVVGCGTELAIAARPGTRFVFCTAAGAASSQPGLTRLRPDADFKPSAAPPAEALIGPVPQCRSDNVFTDEAARYRAGTWDSTPYRRIVRPHRLNELMHILAGGVRFASPEGDVLTVGAGDALFVPKGASIGWESDEHVSKFYVVQEVGA